MIGSKKGSHTDDDISKIKSLANAETSHWRNGFWKVYLTNRIANTENERYKDGRTELEREHFNAYKRLNKRYIEANFISGYLWQSNP